MKGLPNTATSKEFLVYIIMIYNVSMSAVDLIKYWKDSAVDALDTLEYTILWFGKGKNLYNKYLSLLT